MHSDNKTLDLVLEDNTNFGFLLSLYNTTEECTNHPVTGELINCVEVDTPLDVTGFAFAGKIAKSLEEGSLELTSFIFDIVEAPTGRVMMQLTETQIKNLVTNADAKRDIYNPRLRFLGYYDVNTTDLENTTVTRIMQGKVFISDGVTD